MNLLQRQLVKWLGIKDALEQKSAVFPMNTPIKMSRGMFVAPMDNKNKYITDGYSINDVIYSVINLILNKVKQPNWKLYQVTNNSSLKRANSILGSQNPNLSVKNYKEALRLKDESLDEITSFNLQTGKLNDLLDYPNPQETFEEFIVKSCLFKLLTGDSYTWAELLGQGANGGIPNSMWVLPSQFITINSDGGFPAQPIGYEIFSWNQRYATKEILHELFPNPNFSISGAELYGFAPLRAFAKNTDRNNAAKDASTSKFINGGLEEIVYFDDPKVTTDPAFAKAQMDALKLKMAEEYGGPLNQGKRAFTGYKVGTASMGLSPVDLGIIDSEKWDAIMFCNGYNVPPELLGLTAKTFNNMIEAQKALILGAAMPLLDARRRALNRKITTDWGFVGKNVYIDYETDCFPELEADVSKTMDWMSKVTMAKPNEERIAVGLDALTDPEADEVWVLSQGGVRVPLSDYQANLVDQSLQNGANGQTNLENGNGGNSANGQGNGGVLNGNAKNVRLAKVV